MTDHTHVEKPVTTPASLEQAEELLRELRRRLRVVTDEALDHLVKQGALAPIASDGCCKPDGGTCCPNAQQMLASKGTST